MSPLPLDSEVQLVLDVDKYHIQVTGVVRTSHPSMGNGVGFTKVTPEALQRLEQFLTSLAPFSPNTAGRAASEQEAGSNGTAAPEQGGESPSLEARMEALLELLEKKDIISRNELGLQLRKTNPNG
jgi:hypothetical protein